jgi:hypothetical protein
MKQAASAFAMAALVGLAVGARADEPQQPQGYTDADLNGGYACELSGTLGSAGAVGVAQFRPQGDGTFGAAVLGLNVGGLGVCLYALIPDTGKYEVRPDGTGQARATYAVQPGSAGGCPGVFPISLAFATTGAGGTCDIATLDPGVLLGGTCKKQDR